MTQVQRIEIRPITRVELERIRDIDRTEAIRVGYRQEGARLVRMDVEWNAPAWFDGDGEHSFGRMIGSAKRLLDEGAQAFGAFSGEALAGIAIYQSQLEADMGELALLHVSNAFRRQGVASRLFEQVLRLSQQAGDKRLYVSATPSGSAVGFYTSRGFRPTATPHPDLLAEEPDDIHMILELD